MPTFALLTKLSPETTANLDSKEEMGRTWYAKIRQSCPSVHWLHHFAILGPYDFMDIYEAENEEEAAKVSMITLASGAVEAINWTLIPYKRYLAMITDLESKGIF
jgi:uncharacterized protein with GYD domain